MYLGWFEHDLGWIVKEGQGTFGQSMRTHKNSREFHISFPRVHHLLSGETLKVYEHQIHKSLHKSEIPAIAEDRKEQMITVKTWTVE